MDPTMEFIMGSIPYLRLTSALEGIVIVFKPLQATLIGRMILMSP